MQKHITAADTVPVRVVIVTLDAHLAGTIERVEDILAAEIPGLSLAFHAAADWEHDQHALARCRADIEKGDIIFASMLFMEDHIEAVLPSLKARRDSCDAMVGCMSAGEVIRLTRLGSFSMDGSQGGAMALLKRLRGSSKKENASGAQQMAVLRRIPKILRFIPGAAQDVRAYFLLLQYWLAGSEENVVNLVRYLVERYASGPRRALRGTIKAAAPAEYPDVGVYHPRLPRRVSEDASALPKPADCRGTVGLLVMRSYILAGNSAHYDSVIEAFERRGLAVIPAFSTGLDARPAIDFYFKNKGVTKIDALVSLTGFSLVGGPAYNDSKAAAVTLADLDVPYIAAHAVEFQSLDQWEASERGLMPVEQTIMVAIPELDGATGPMVFGGRAEDSPTRAMSASAERAAMLASRVSKLVALRKEDRAKRKIAIALFNFPPNGGATGTAAFLSVYASLFNVLKELAANDYTVDVPESIDALRDRIIVGNAARYGTPANVAARISAADHVRSEPYLADIERQWGPAPGRQQSDGSSIFVLGAEFGNVFVGIQPAFGYEGDPMRLLFERGFAPTHAFSAFYRYLRETWKAHAILHFGTHGALEFMPGKQAGLSETCWPDRMIGDLPNFYLYAANNPSEGTLAKRRAAATLVSYLTPPISHAGLYRGLLDLKASLERHRALEPEAHDERKQLAILIQAQAANVDLAPAEPAWSEVEVEIDRLWKAVLELEYTLIPNGLHVIGEAMTAVERAELLVATAETTHNLKLDRAVADSIANGASAQAARQATPKGATPAPLEALDGLASLNTLLSKDHELAAIVHALDARFVRPSPSGDLLRSPDILPTGRNIHGFDPFRIPSAFASREGHRQAGKLLARYMEDGSALPETIAMVLWGTDNLKTEGGPIAQALALMGARPRFDSYGRLSGAQLIPLSELGRPRIDVVITLSGIFRDLLPLQTKLLAEAAFLAATADETDEQNFILKHARAYAAEKGCDMETAALRVFSNADGAYGANVNQLIETSSWDDENELADTYTKRKSFAYGRSGKPVQQTELLTSMLAGVKLTYQNLESMEVGVTTIDQYFDTLGGISRAVKRAGGGEVPVYIGDQTRGDGVVRSLSEQVAVETRTRMLNPKWYESMLKHGYEGVRNIEAHVTNAFGWSATTGQVAPWVYQQLTETYVLDPEMRERLAALNPAASAKVANRLLEAHSRNYWNPEPDVLEALRRAGEELEDRIEGVGVEAAA